MESPQEITIRFYLLFIFQKKKKKAKKKTNTSLRSSLNFSTVRRLKLGSALGFVTKVDSLTVGIFNQTYDV